jgi:uncharacterized membrane protein YeaQ/YmgE (transglycosylase-associated protein family)
MGKQVLGHGESRHMLERIIVGIAIGLVAGFVLSKSTKEGSSARSIILGFIALVVIAFVGSSFMFGAIYGAMAVGEIAIGYWIASQFISEQKA